MLRLPNLQDVALIRDKLESAVDYPRLLEYASSKLGVVDALKQIALKERKDAKVASIPQVQRNVREAAVAHKLDEIDAVKPPQEVDNAAIQSKIEAKTVESKKCSD